MYDPKGYHGPSSLKRAEPDSPESQYLRRKAQEAHAQQERNKTMTIEERRAASDPFEFTPAPRFPMTYCSSCGEAFGPGDHGFSHCKNHKGKLPLTAREEYAADLRADR